jgi:hypothetical protein
MAASGLVDELLAIRLPEWPAVYITHTIAMKLTTKTAIGLALTAKSATAFRHIISTLTSINQ